MSSRDLDAGGPHQFGVAMFLLLDCVRLTAGMGGRSIEGMAQVGWAMRHRGLVLGAAVLAPLVASAVMSMLRNYLDNTNAALVLVLLVVAAASTGIRLAGILAALSSAAWFDFFLTAPYLTFRINDRADIETTVLLVLVGAAVSEIAYWGRRQQAQASRHEGFLAGVIEAAGVVAAGDSPTDTLVDHVERQLVEILNLDDCVFRSTISSGLPVLQPDGTVARNGRVVDTDRSGLPTDTQIQLLAQSGGTIRGEFLLTAATHIARPSLEARRVAVTLADQVAAAIATAKPDPAST
jgi:K+-sensing histidine kinase KdpD